MGTRSMNVLAIKSTVEIPKGVKIYLDNGDVRVTAEGMMWTWETNISPFHARSAVFDLAEEVAILGWVLTLPAADFLMIRVGDDGGKKGTWEDHPFKDFSSFIEFEQSYEAAFDLPAPLSDKQVADNATSLSNVQLTQSMLLNVPQLFADSAFVAWLNNGKPKMTWHAGGTPTEWSDVIVMVDPSLTGEGTDSDMPEYAWDLILQACRAHATQGSGYHIMVRLTNMVVA